nr:RidA family protein [Acidobacteriota bacterium]
MNGQAYILHERAKALARYPHMRRVGGLLYVSGTSSRRPDNSFDGVTLKADGTVELDIRAQTRAVIENIRLILREAGADLTHLVDVTVFLVDMKDYTGYNE